MYIEFTLTIYKNLIQTLLNKGYKIVPFIEYLNNKQRLIKIIILRHDVDKKPQNSLLKAKIEAKHGINSTYYFRSVPQSFNEKIIKEIAELGHEIGYHYEDLSLARGDYELAIKNFEKNLSILRKFYSVKTICMHGSPLSKWDNKKLWEKYNYKDFGIIAEPYLDLNFNEIFYLTDTGRSWNNKAGSVRDKVQTNFTNNYNSTDVIISAIKNGSMPDKVMINTHPQRWSDNNVEWISEYVTQTIKNIIKKSIIHYYNKRNK
jgi:hypothetical protein